MLNKGLLAVLCLILLVGMDFTTRPALANDPSTLRDIIAALKRQERRIADAIHDRDAFELLRISWDIEDRGPRLADPKPLDSAKDAEERLLFKTYRECLFAHDVLAILAHAYRDILITNTGAIRCLIPDFDGALFSPQWRDALWARFFTAAPRRQRRSVERYNIVKRA